MSPDGAYLAVGGSGHLVTILDSASGARRRDLHGHWGEVWSLAFSPEATTLYSGSGGYAGIDNSIKVWQVP